MGLPINNLKALFFAVIMMGIGTSCIPKKAPGEGESASTSVKQLPPTFSVTSVKVGSNASPSFDQSGNYYSRVNPLTVKGVCQGTIKQVQVTITPQSGAATNELVTCSSAAFTWSKTFSVEKAYTLKFTAMDGNATAITSFATITKNFTYDATAPTQPSFLTPTTGATYTISNGTTSVTITGQTLTDAVRLVGPNNLDVALTPNVDGIHNDFSYVATVPVGTNLLYGFATYDFAGNSSSNSLRIISLQNILITASGNDLGSSLVNAGLIIQSSVAVDAAVVTNQTVKLQSGTTAIMGGAP